jgi:hypothetical protein
VRVRDPHRARGACAPRAGRCAPRPRRIAARRSSRPLSAAHRLAALTAVAGSAAIAGEEPAATFQKAPVIRPGATIPIDFAGYKEPANRKRKGGYRIVVVRASLARGEQASTVITAPRGFRLVTIGFDEGSQLGARTEDAYVGKRSVRLTLFANANRVAEGQTGHATIYALARHVG